MDGEGNRYKECDGRHTDRVRSDRLHTEPMAGEVDCENFPGLHKTFDYGTRKIKLEDSPDVKGLADSLNNFLR